MMPGPLGGLNLAGAGAPGSQPTSPPRRDAPVDFRALAAPQVSPVVVKGKSKGGKAAVPKPGKASGKAAPAKQLQLPSPSAVPGAPLAVAPGGAASSAAEAAAKAGGQGRPGRPYWREVDDLARAFQKAPADDPLWWGTEQRTQVKQLKRLNNDITKRLTSNKIELQEQ